MHGLRRRITAPSEKRIRTLVHAINTEIRDEIIGGGLCALAAAGRLDAPLTAVPEILRDLSHASAGQVAS